MDPLPAFFMISLLAVFPLAWLGGGHTERAGVALYLCLYIVGRLTQHIQIGNPLLAPALVDLVFLIGLAWLALKRERWWPLVASALQVMVMLVYVGAMLVPGFNYRSGIVAIMVLGVLGLYCLLGGVLERILAGETPASASAVWRRRPPARQPNS
ncbi:hypothetical protein [Brevundimonas sp.]|uniref:hypothetical protein n=1 Tax=Brevundimonas sp. TaxID=1871086 RepID=UPI003A9349BF